MGENQAPTATLANFATISEKFTSEYSSKSAESNSRFTTFCFDLCANEFAKGPSLLNEETKVPRVLSVLPRSTEYHLSSPTNTTHLLWYDRWLDQQLENVPPFITSRLKCASRVFLEIARLAKTKSSIEDIATNLIHLDLISAQGADDGREVARNFVFAAFGWQTMLYEPAFGTCPPKQLAIADVLDGYTGQAFMTLKQDHSRIKCCIPDFLLGFGLMLPKENLCISEDAEDCEAFEKVVMINPEALNAALLQSLAGVSIKWVDVMAPHLEFDMATNTLFLFRYPSFCMANIPPQGALNITGVIHG